MKQTTRILVEKMLARANYRKGQFFGMKWTRAMKTRKGEISLVTKTVHGVFMLGATYDNRETVKEARANGDLPATNQGLPWGEWDLFPYVITHKGNDYLRFYPIRGENRALRVSYAIDGKPATRAEVEPLCLASEFRESPDFACFTINADNVMAIK